MIIPIRNRVLATITGLGRLCLAGMILWQISLHGSSQHCVAYVHVSMPNVDVTVDGVEYHVASLWESPIVCDLRPGRHTLRMYRSGQVLFEEPFTLRSDEQVVLVAWDQRNEIPSPLSVTRR
jgi:hypothetical protein